MQANELRTLLEADGWFMFEERPSMLTEQSTMLFSRPEEGNYNILVMLIADDGDGLLFRRVNKLGEIFPQIKTGMVS